ncbi:MAG: DUF3592 domain-containing protein [Hyphomicrobiales bacterium]
MGTEKFWYFFGGIFLLVGLGFLGLSLGVNVFADPDLPNKAPVWLFVLAGLVMTGAGGSIVYFARAAGRRDLRLMQAGVALKATVTDVRRSNISINRQTRWHVRYSYEYPPGQKRQGESRSMPGEAVMGYRPGDTVDIKADPQKPEASVFLGA